MKYQIMDWAGNEMWSYGLFDTFEDAWGCLMQHFESEDDLQEFYVVERNFLKGARS